jgi:hypothetical protein
MEDQPSFTLTCVVCGKPISLQSATTDGAGRPVHSDCYASELRPSDTTVPPASIESE